MLKILVESVSQMHSLAGAIAEISKGGDLIGLSGSLGTGKTEFAKGFAKNLGCRELVVSPTYNIEIIYTIDSDKISELLHFDCYRIETLEPSESADLERFRECSLREDALSLVEWPEKIDGLKDLLSLHLHIEFVGSNEAHRLVSIELPSGSRLGAEELKEIESFNG